MSASSKLGRQTDLTVFNPDGTIRSSHTNVELDTQALPTNIHFTMSNGDELRVGQFFELHTHDADKTTNT